MMHARKHKPPSALPSPIANPFDTFLEPCPAGWITVVRLGERTLFACLCEAKAEALAEAEAWSWKYRHTNFEVRR